MEHVASLHERVQGTLYHYVLRWRGVESPTDGQAFDAVAATLPALHMRGHQRVAAVHRNTDHVHTHVTVNPFNPKTLKSVYPKGDWLTLDRACWELELKTVGATIAAITVCRHRHADGGGASTTLLRTSGQHSAREIEVSRRGAAVGLFRCGGQGAGTAAKTTVGTVGHEVVARARVTGRVQLRIPGERQRRGRNRPRQTGQTAPKASHMGRFASLEPGGAPWILRAQ